MAVAAGILMALTALGLSTVQTADAPPELAPEQASEVLQPEVSAESPVALNIVVQPWIRVTSGRTTSSPARAIPAIVEPPPLQEVRHGDLAYVAKVVTEDESTTYYFKELASGALIGLKVGENRNGWSIKQVGDKVFVLDGPGGIYEIVR